MFARMTKAKKLEQAKKFFMDAMSADVDYQKEARDDFDFRNNKQWTQEEKNILEKEMRPSLTFNLIKSSIDLVIGMSTDNNKKYRCSPVEQGDEFLTEVLNDILEWIYDSNDFVNEEVSGLESAAICGRGYLAVDFVPDPKRFGDIKLSLVDVPVHEIHFDPASRRGALEDASYICWDKWLSRADFKIRYPKVADRKIDALVKYGTDWDAGGGVGMTTNDPINPVPAEVADDTADYELPMDLTFYDRTKNMIRIVHMEYWESYKKHFGYNPQTGEWEEFDGADLKRIKAEFEQATGEEFVFETLMDKKVKWLQFVGNDILYDDDSPLPYDGFSICNMFAYRDPSQRTSNHFGIVRLMKDPQREINKRWSQALHMLNQQVQSGVFAETDAFVDQAQAEESMREAGSITWVNPGSINGGKFKIREIPKFPNAPMQMEQFSQDILKRISGINHDLLGQDRGRQEPGVVVRLRQQQGMTLLKPLFNNYNAMKKNIFKRLLAIVMAYMPDSQIMRILGQNKRYQIDKQTGAIIDPVNKLQADIRDIRNLEYNINADNASASMTQKMFELTSLLEMQKVGFPVDPMVVIEKMELPISDKLRWMEYIQSQMESQQEAAEREAAEKASIEDRKVAATEMQNQMDFVVDMLKIAQMSNKDDKKQATDFAKLDLESKKMLADFTTQMASTLVQKQNAAKKEGGTDAKSKANKK